MNSQNHDQCFAAETEIRKALGFKIGDFRAYLIEPQNRIYQVFGPNGYHWTGPACCRWAARTEAYDAFERHLKLEAENV